MLTTVTRRTPPAPSSAKAQPLSTAWDDSSCPSGLRRRTCAVLPLTMASNCRSSLQRRVCSHSPVAPSSPRANYGPSGSPTAAWAVIGTTADSTRLPAAACRFKRFMVPSLAVACPWLAPARLPVQRGRQTPLFRLAGKRRCRMPFSSLSVPLAACVPPRLASAPGRPPRSGRSTNGSVLPDPDQFRRYSVQAAQAGYA